MLCKQKEKATYSVSDISKLGWELLLPENNFGGNMLGEAMQVCINNTKDNGGFGLCSSMYSSDC